MTSFELSINFFRKIQQFFMSDFLYSKYAKRRRICGMSRAEKNRYRNTIGSEEKLGKAKTLKYWKMKRKTRLEFSDKPHQKVSLQIPPLECKKSLIKNCWIFLKKYIDTSKLFFMHFQNIWEEIIHVKYVQILI